jgi:hypothetical protein
MVVYGPDQNPAEEVATGTAAFTSLSEQSAVGNGLVMVGGAVRLNHAMWVIASVGVTVGGVTLQGSVDGVNFVNLASEQSIAGPFSDSYVPLLVQNQLAQYLRAVVTTTIVGGSVTVLVASV